MDNKEYGGLGNVKVIVEACAYNAISPDSEQKQQHKSPPVGKPKHDDSST